MYLQQMGGGDSARVEGPTPGEGCMPEHKTLIESAALDGGLVTSLMFENAQFLLHLFSLINTKI